VRRTLQLLVVDIRAKLSPAGALSVVLAPTRKESGLIAPPVICSLRSQVATPKCDAKLIAAISPFSSNAIPLGLIPVLAAALLSHCGRA
jgi:hypothetical protein